MTRKKGFMNFTQFKKLILNLNKASFLKEVAIAGIGEPTLHPDIISMIYFIKKHTPFKVVLTTNASKLNDDSFAKRLLQSEVDKITVSLRISDPAKNRSSLSPNFDHKKYMQSILDLVSVKRNLNLATEIELSFLKETFYSKYILGITTDDYIDNARLNVFVRKLSENMKIDLLPYDDFTKGIVRHLSNVDRIPIMDGVSFRFDSLSSWTTSFKKFGKTERCYPAQYGSCLGMLTHFAIYWNGDVSTCCADFDVKNRLGNIFEEKDIKKILSKKESVILAENLRKKRMPTKTCRICRGGSSRKEKWANMIGTFLYQK